MLSHIYGWVPFNQNCKTAEGDRPDAGANALCKTPLNEDPDKNVAAKCTPTYHAIHKLYRGLQYAYERGITSQYHFNPYVELIHGSNYLNMSAYAFSIDDADGNMQEVGDGIIITIGGARGLENKERFHKQTAINVNAPPQYKEGVNWKSYGACIDLENGICKKMTDFPISKNESDGTETVISHAKFAPLMDSPSWIVLTDTENRIYRFKATVPDCDASGECKINEGNIDKSSCIAPALVFVDGTKGSWCDGLVSASLKGEGDEHYVNNRVYTN